jgi:hypothetical protein
LLLGKVLSIRFRNDQTKRRDYFLAGDAAAGATAGVAGFIAPVDVAAGAAVELAGAIGAGVLAAGVATAGLLTALVVLFAVVPPHAIPRALRPKTAENTNTFVILFKTPNLSQRI